MDWGITRKQPPPSPGSPTRNKAHRWHIHHYWINYPTNRPQPIPAEPGAEENKERGKKKKGDRARLSVDTTTTRPSTQSCLPVQLSRNHSSSPIYTARVGYGIIKPPSREPKTQAKGPLQLTPKTSTRSFHRACLCINRGYGSRKRVQNGQKIVHPHTPSLALPRDAFS
ncbi:hypothetical protein VTI28DRAFT_3868 [Corynascus sepedonium]